MEQQKLPDTSNVPCTSEVPKPFHPNDYEIGTIVRIRTMGAYKIEGSKAWGRYLAKVPDPEGTSISKKIISNFSLNSNFPKIPAELWSRYTSLCFYMCPPNGRKLSRSDHDSQLEVQVCLLRDQETLTKWKMVVPKQVVTGAHVEADLRKSVDIETGEEYDMFPPLGWIHAGSSHSHNTMPAFYSSIDDASELSVPGLHIVVGAIDHKKMEYEYVASIVLRKNRKSVDLFEVVDTEPVPDCPFHDKVLEYISIVIETNKNLFRRSQSNYVSNAGPRWIGGTSSKFDSVPIEDEDGKLNSFFRFLNRQNSDIFDEVPEGIDITSISDDMLKTLAKEDAFSQELFRIAEDDEDIVMDEQILRDMEKSNEI